MLDQIKRKRLYLTHQLELTRPRLKSSQKRKLIEANLQKFKRDVQDSRSSSPFQSANEFYPRQNTQLLNQSPTMRDLINPFRKNSSQIQQKQEVQSPRFKEQSEKSLKIEPQDISPTLIIQQSKPQFQKGTQINIDKPQNKYDIQLENSSENNSSLLNNLLNRPQILSQQNLVRQKLEKQISFGQNVIVNPIISPRSIKNGSSVHNINMQPSYEKNLQDNQLNFNYNESNYGGGSSNGSGILFTSQLRDYINRDKQPVVNTKIQQIQPITHGQSQKRKTQLSEHHTQTDKQIGESFLKIGEQQLSSGGQSRRKLTHNQSGRSLAFSNQQSMLKQSKINENAVQQMIYKKLDQQLVLEIDHFVNYKFKEIANLYDNFIYKQQLNRITKDLKLLNQLIKFQKKTQYNLKRYCFDGLLILKQYKFQQVKNQIKADNFHKQLNTKLSKQTFQSWKRIGLENQKIILYNSAKRQEKMKKNIFQVFKMIWFDSKVKHQVDLYYLSKIFSALRSACMKQKKKWENSALKQYCRSLKRTYFYKMQQGIQTMKKQRLDTQLADQHYRITTIKKFFDSWLEQCDRSPQYVSLTMTSKNVFKQTLDNKWLGIKTVDFKQVKQ